MGSSPRERAKQYDAKFRADVDAAMDRIEPYIAPASALALELCREILTMLEEVARGDEVSARQRRQRAVERWNRLVHNHGADHFPFPRLCEHCGKPLFLIAPERQGRSLTAPARVHRQCQKAFRAASRRKS